MRIEVVYALPDAQHLVAGTAEDLAVVDRTHDRREVGVAREEHAHRVGRRRAHLAKHLDAGEARHALVAHEDVDSAARHDLERRRAALGDLHVVFLPEERGEGVQDARVVVDEEDVGPAVAGGLRRPLRRRGVGRRCGSRLRGERLDVLHQG